MSRPTTGTLAVALFFSSVPVLAQEAARPEPHITPQASVPQAPLAEPEVTLDVLVQQALENNPQPAIARANIEAARQRAGALGTLANPVLLASPGAGGTSSSRDEELILSQPLDVFGQRRAQRNVANAEVRRTEAEATRTTRALVIAVRNGAASLFAAQEEEAFGQTQYELATSFYNAAARRAQQGDVPLVQAERAKVEQERAANDLDNARAERLTRRAALNLLIGQSPESPLRVALPLPADWTSTLDTLQWSTTTPKDTPVPNGNTTSNVGAMSSVGLPATADMAVKREQLLTGALNRPDILSAQATLEARRAQVNAVNRQRLPEVSIQARRDGVVNSASGTSVRALVTVPIFDFGSIRREKRAAQADVVAQEAQVILLKQQAAAELEQALIRLHQQRLTVERYRTSIIPQTLDLLRKTQIGFAQGASTYLEVLEAQRSVRQVQNEYLQAVVGVRTSESAVEAAVGAPLPAANTGTSLPSTVPNSSRVDNAAHTDRSPAASTPLPNNAPARTTPTPNSND